MSELRMSIRDGERVVFDQEVDSRDEALVTVAIGGLVGLIHEGVTVSLITEDGIEDIVRDGRPVAPEYLTAGAEATEDEYDNEGCFMPGFDEGPRDQGGPSEGYLCEREAAHEGDHAWNVDGYVGTDYDDDSDTIINARITWPVTA